jgi:diguanylate cyclase (GGDEF)-like protein
MSNNNNYNLLEQGIERPVPIRPLPDLVWFYGLWITIAWISVAVGHSNVSPHASLFLLGGVTCTNLFFMFIRQNEVPDEGLAKVLAVTQTVMGIAWISAFFYFSRGAGELVLGMYMTVLMFSVFHVDRSTLIKLAAGTVFSYLLIVAIELVSAPGRVVPLQDGLRLLILIGIAGWACVFRRQLSELRSRLQDRNEELQDMVEKVSRVAAVDDLTKSFNRRHIMEVLAREQSRASRVGNGFAILLFDLDKFKDINDQFGHLVGDRVLRDFAERVKGELRGIDMLNPTDHKKSFGRYGGEEFIAVLPGSNLKGAEQVAERIRRIVYEKAFVDIYTISVSVGVAEYQAGETITELMTRADEALYQAKGDGRNRVRCSIFHYTDPDQNEKGKGKGPNLRILK